MPDPFGNDSTRAGLLGTLVVDQCYHAGQLGMARRAAGHKAAILAPGRPRRSNSVSCRVRP